MGYPTASTTFGGRPSSTVTSRPAGGEVEKLARLIPSVRLSAPYRKERKAGAPSPAPPPHDAPILGGVHRVTSEAVLSRVSSRGPARDSLSASMTPTHANRVSEEPPTIGKVASNINTNTTNAPPPPLRGNATRPVKRTIKATMDTLGEDEDSIRDALAPSQRHLLQHQAKYSRRQNRPDGTSVVSTGHGYVSSTLPMEQARQQELLINHLRREKDHTARRQALGIEKRAPSPKKGAHPLNSLKIGEGDNDSDLDDTMSRTTTQSEQDDRIITRSVPATRLLEAVNCDGALHLCSQSNHWTKVHDAKEENLRLRTLQRMTACALSTQLHDQARLQQTSAGYSQRHGEVAARKLELMEGKLVGSFERFLVNQHRREIAKHSHESRLLNSRTKEWLTPIIFALATRKLIQSVRVARAREVLRRLFVGRFLSYLRKTKSRQLRAETVLAHEASIVEVPPLDVLRANIPAMARLPEPLLLALLQPACPPPSRYTGPKQPQSKTTSSPQRSGVPGAAKAPPPPTTTTTSDSSQAIPTNPAFGVNNILAPRPAVEGAADGPIPPPSPVGCGVLERRCFLPEEFISYAGEPGDMCFILYRGAVECPSETAVVRSSIASSGNSRVEPQVRGTTMSEDGGVPQTDLSQVALNYRRQLAFTKRINGQSTSMTRSSNSHPSIGDIASLQGIAAAVDGVLHAPPLITARWSVVCHSTLWTADPYEHTFRAASHKAIRAAERVLQSSETAAIDGRPPSPWLFSLPSEDGSPPASVGGADFWVIRQDKFTNACQRYFADQKINLKALRTVIDQQQLAATNRRRRQSMTSDAGTDIDSAVESEGHSETRGDNRQGGTMGSLGGAKGANALTARLSAAKNLLPSEPIPLQVLERQLEGIASACQWHIRVADAHRERIMLRHRNLTPETVRKASQLFAKFSAEGIRMLIQAAKPVVCRRDDVVIKPGQYGRKVLLVVAGRLEMLLDRRKRLQVLTEGTCVGDTAAALGRKDPRVSVRALTSSDVWQIDHKDLDMVVVREDPAMLMTVAVTSLDENGCEKVFRGA